MIALCNQVTVIPDNNNKHVLYKGNKYIGITVTPTGGNSAPIKIDGHKDAWKNAQKNPKNNITSEAINSKNPEVIPICTAIVWSPAPVASSIISSTHVTEDTYNIIIPNKKGHALWITPCIANVKVDTKKNAPIPVNKGHGLRGKIWKRCLLVDAINNLIKNFNYKLFASYIIFKLK